MSYIIVILIAGGLGFVYGAIWHERTFGAADKEPPKHPPYPPQGGMDRCMKKGCNEPMYEHGYCFIRYCQAEADSRHGNA